MNELWSKTPFTFQLSMQNPEYNRVGISYPLTEHSHYAKKRILLRQKPSYGLPLEKLAISPPAHGLRMQNIYHKTKTTVFSFSLPLLKFHSLSTLDQMKQ